MTSGDRRTPPGGRTEVRAADAAADAAARRAALLGAVGATSIIAHQVGGKAVRDAYFLANYDVTSLPTMVIIAALVSIGAVLGTSTLLQSVGPRRVVPLAFAGSGLLHLVEWGVAASYPGVAAVWVYLHVAVLGGILISSFWSLINECFTDPRRARRHMARISGAGTLGGVLGGLLAGWVGSAFSIPTTLLVLGALHLVAAGFTLQLRPAAREQDAGGGTVADGFRVLRDSRYLLTLGRLVLAVTLGAALLDYVFKSAAAARYAEGDALIRFFATFHTGVGLLTFLLQTSLGRIALERLGLSRTVGTLPLLAGVGSLAAAAVPGVAAAAAARASEAVLRSSLYRSGYEVLFNPVPARRKRSTKTLIDVGFDRLGDALGGGFVTLLLLLGPATARPWIAVLAAACFAVGVLLVPRLQRGYVKTLAESIRDRAVEIDLETVADPVTRTTVMQSLSGLDLSTVIDGGAETAAEAGHGPAGEGAAVSAPEDPLLARIADLRSRDPDRVRRAIASEATPSAATAAHLMPLLAWNEVAPEVIRALRRAAPHITGQLVDALLDPDEEFAIRRRIPRVLALCPTDRAVEGLKQGLADRRFEVRYQCGLALNRIHDLAETIPVTREEIFAAVEREVRVDRRMWESYRLIDRLEPDEESGFIDETISDRAGRSLEHVFTLLSLVLKKEPLRIAFRGLHTADAVLRGTALEYLEQVLPRPIRDKLWPFLDAAAGPAAGPARSREEVLEDLLRSNDSIQIRLEEVRRRRRAE